MQVTVSAHLLPLEVFSKVVSINHLAQRLSGSEHSRALSHKNVGGPWPGGLVGWSVIPYTKKVAGLIRSQGLTGGNQSVFLSHIDVALSLAFSLLPSPSKMNKHILR